MTARRNTGSTRDWGPPELARRFTVVPKLSGLNSFTGKVVDESEMDRLLLNDDITSSEHGLLMALLNKLRRGSFITLQSPDLNGIIQSRDASAQSDHKAEVIRTVVLLIRDMDRVMGKDRRKALINLALIEVPWPYGIKSLKACLLQLSVIFSRN